MRIKRIHLKGFKRFTDFEITGISQDTKLVVVVGPNGSGKSSLFDAFITWHRVSAGWGQDNDNSYFQKDRKQTLSVNETVTVETHEGHPPIRGSLYVRTAYRNDPDFNIGSISRLKVPSEELRVQKSIQNDQVVSQNYQRLVYDTISGVYDAENDGKSVAELRKELIGEVRNSMSAVFDDLVLNNITDPLGEGTFTFRKGAVRSYNYKNLSGGEKSAFDLLLDLHMKKRFYSDAIWCIDEMETHLHTGLQGKLLREMYNLVPPKAQLWLTTHSLGVMREAQALNLEHPGTVAILDFDGVDPDEQHSIIPSSVGRVAWEKMLSIAIDDLSSRIVPRFIVVCEGSSIGSRRKNFDAEIYNRVLGRLSPDVIFVSGGSSSELDKTKGLIRETLKDLLRDAIVVSLCDRDDKSDAEVVEFELGGNLVLGKRNLESYLLADDVLLALVRSLGQLEQYDTVLAMKADAIRKSVARNNSPDDLKSAAGDIFTGLKHLLRIPRGGNNTEAFLRDTLAPLIKPGMATYSELKSEILDRL